MEFQVLAVVELNADLHSFESHQVQAAVHADRRTLLRYRISLPLLGRDDLYFASTINRPIW